MLKRVTSWFAARAEAPVAPVRADGGGNWGGQLANWRVRISGPNATTAMERESARARSRELIRSDPIAAGAILTNLSHVVGTGLSMRPAIDHEALAMTEEAARKWQRDVARRFQMWSSSPNADAGGRLDFFGLQLLALRTTLSSGDAFAMLPAVSVPGWPARFAVQLVEADRVSNPDRRQDEPGRLVAGIELGATGRAVAYHVSDQHPGVTSTLAWTRIVATGRSGRRNMLHLYEMDRPDQVRGVPYLSGVIGKLKDLSRFGEAELAAAVTNAALAVFTKMDPEAFQEIFEKDGQQQIIDRATSWDGEIRPNTAINLLPGEEVMVPDSKRPSVNFDPFFLAIVRQIGVGLEIPFEILIKHFTASYSASRAAMLDAWRVFRRRRDWLAKTFCQPIYEEWLTDEIVLGRIAAPGFLEDPMRRWAFSQAQWIGDGPGALDPNKEIEAAGKRIELGISTREAESILHDGVDWETKTRQLEREARARKEAGLDAPPPVAPPPGQQLKKEKPPVPGQVDPDQAEPADDAVDDEEDA